MDAAGVTACGTLLAGIDPRYRPQRFGPFVEAAEISATFRTDLEIGRSVVVIAQCASNDVVGFVAVDRPTGEIEYCIAPQHWRAGFASEAFAVLLPILLTAADTDRLYARTKRENIGSRALLEKYAFRFAGLDRVEGETLARFVGPAC